MSLPITLLAPSLANNIQILQWAANQPDRMSTTGQCAKEFNRLLPDISRVYRYFLAFGVMKLEFVEITRGLYKRGYRVTDLGMEVLHAFA